MSFYDAIRVGASGAADFEVERSLRFNDDDSASLNRTPSSAGNRKTFTFSFWVKRGNLGVSNKHIFAIQIDSSNQFVIRFTNSDKLQIYDYQSASMQLIFDTDAVFRDVSAWYHIVVAVDTTQSTNTNRFKLYVNNSQVTSFSSSTYPSQNHDTIVNTTNAHYIGQKNSSLYFDGYLTEYNFIDGSALTPSSFGETNAKTGQWIPKKPSVTYGTNGFRLNFSDNSGTTATTLGKDLSGNGNNFTPNNFVTGDAVKDSPTNNFCTLNPIGNNSGGSLSNGSLQRDVTASVSSKVEGTFAVSSGKWYWEVNVISGSGNFAMIGIKDISINGHETDFWNNNSVYAYYGASGEKYNSGSNTSYGATYTNGDIIGVALDLDAGTLIFYKNNTSQGTAFSSLTGTYNAYVGTGLNAFVCVFNFGQDSTFAGNETAQGNTDGNGQGDFYYAPPSGYKALCSANLVDPTILLPNKHFDTLLWSGDGTANRAITGLDFQPDWVWLKSRTNTDYHQRHDSNRGASAGALFHVSAAEDPNYPLDSFDSNGFTTSEAGDQQNTSGQNYVAWNWDAGETDGATYRVVVVSDSGNKYRFRNSANTATFAQSAVVLDLAEGGTYTFDQSDSTMSSHPMKLSTTANGTHGGGTSYNTGVTYQLDGSTVTESAFVSGFSSATSRKLIITVAASAPTLYYYCHYHSGMGSSINTNSTLGSSNFDGDLQSVTKVNTTAGFSIVKWTSGGNLYKTVGHGLGVKPSIVILKARTTSNNWFVYFDVVDGTNDFMELSATNASLSAESYSIVPPTSTVFGTDGAFVSGSSNIPHIAYVFSSVSSYSKIGKYKGNGNADGTFVFTGFRPAWVMLKRADSADHWIIKDSKRNTRNDVFSNLGADIANAEFGSSANVQSADFLSNGFKLRGTDSGVNANNGTYIYLAFAESPFKNSRAR
tara:strand:- start:3171 stop:5969 length:2799 start_codon:yes stop_codon:yes gene_type:complete